MFGRRPISCGRRTPGTGRRPFPVAGTVGLGASGRVYVGGNLEFRGVPLCHSVHTEQFLATNAAAARESALRVVAVSHMTYGHCHQFLQEICGASGIQMLVSSDAEEGCAPEWRTVASLLICPFGPHDLLPKEVPLVLERHHNPLGEPFPTVTNGFATGDLEGRLREAAEVVTWAAYASYSECPSGFAMANDDDRIYVGGCLESTAYNPTLGPVQAAIIAMIAAEGGPAGDLVAAALVEKEWAAVVPPPPMAGVPWTEPSRTPWQGIFNLLPP